MVYDTPHNQYRGFTTGMGSGAIKWNAVFAVFGTEQVADGTGLDSWTIEWNFGTTIHWHVK